jgi:hypothetical protein
MLHFHKCWVIDCDTPVECGLDCMEAEPAKHPVCAAHLLMFQALDKALNGWPHESSVNLKGV